MIRASAALTASFLAGLLLLASPAAAAPGDLDPTFGGGGFFRAAAGENDYVGGIAAYPDGSAVVAGTTDVAGDELSFVTRAHPDGSPDLGFGPGGVRLLPSLCGADEVVVQNVAIQADGKILLSGECSSDVLLARLNPDGSLDQGFDGDPGNPGGGNGVVRTTFPGAGSGLEIAIDPADGSILLAGICCTGVLPRYQDAAFVRYESDGRLDVDFDGPGGNPGGGNGRVVRPINTTGDDRNSGLTLLPGGGYAIAGLRDKKAYVAVADVTGKPDKTFSGDGYAEIDYGAVSEGRAVAFDGTGIVLASQVEDPTLSLRVSRFGLDGKVDPAFAELTVDPALEERDFVSDLGLGPDGTLNLLSGGYVPIGESSSFPGTVGLTRLLPGGAPDTAFGPGGTRTYSLPGELLYPQGLGFDQSGGILLGGVGGPYEPFGDLRRAFIARVGEPRPRPVQGATPPPAGFRFAGLKRNRKKGTATLFVEVSGPGALALAGTKRLKGTSKQAGKAGKFGLVVKLKGKAKRKLASRAALKGLAETKVGAKITFTPAGGAAITQSQKVKLVRRG